MLSAVVSSLHLLALAIGLPAVFLRGRALKGPLDADGLRRLLAADNVWGIAAPSCGSSPGSSAPSAGLEKGTDFYLHSPLFWTKMALFLLVFLLEIRPMVTFIRWRMQARPRPDRRHERGPRALHPQPHRAGHRGGDGLRGQPHGSRSRLLASLTGARPGCGRAAGRPCRARSRARAPRWPGSGPGASAPAGARGS